MNQPQLVPVIPETAPFTPEQRAWLNGFLAGIFSRAPLAAPPDTRAQPVTPISILYASQTGNAERLAKRAAKEAAKAGFAPTIHNLAGYPRDQLAAESRILLIASTYGDGEPPDSARAFWSWLEGDAAPKLASTRFTVCALGDSQYPHFCRFGRQLDARLQALGATPLLPRQDCDAEFERDFQTWLGNALAALKPGLTASAAPAPGHAPALPAAEEPEESSWSRSHPYPAPLISNRRLSHPDSGKDVRHFAFGLEDPTVRYEPGDALGVWPVNCPRLVQEILEALGADGEEPVPGRDGDTVPLRLALLQHYELGRVTPAVLDQLARRSSDPELRALASPTANGAVKAFLEGHDLLDLVIRSRPITGAPLSEWVPLLRKLQPRLYSIASSLRAHPGEVHLTVNTVRYELRGRARTGVASCFLADRCAVGSKVPVFVHGNPAFRPPSADVPLIMIGPGTGIAPFRAFLADRRATGARGRNWLFFGDQHAATDFLYRDEIESFLADGTLSRLDLAWSRDRSEKIYVQHRMLEGAAELWRWLEDGAAVYVCGDAKRMARDVDAALHRVIETAGNRSPEEASAYVQNLQANGRYRRDVY